MSDAAPSLFVPSSGEYLRYRTEGSGPRAVLLLHGFAATLRTWDDMAPLFPPEEFTLHLVDLKGHGGSSRESGGDYSPQHNARLVAEYIRSRQLADVTLIGHSFGGAVALLAALDCPEVGRLVLLGAPAFPQRIPFFMRILGLPFIGPLLMNAVPAEMIARGALRRAFYRRDSITGRLIERYAAGYRGHDVPPALARTVRQLVPSDAAHLAARYAGLPIPVLLVWGEHDRIVGPWQGERLHRILPDSRLAIIPDCGHNPHEERPRETFALIHDFLSASIDRGERTC
ncbi:MAG TPA: alpha/beta hydrolase [Desulfuromonadaceae bacterium]